MTHTETTHPEAAPHGKVGAHIMPMPILLAVWAALLVLTAATVAATGVDWGRLNLWIAMIIATVKASLVALYFMHLRYDDKFNALILLTALLFIAIFIGLVLVDSSALQSRVIPQYPSAP
jgi:cytochrome c oxidase subunit IV